MAVEKGAVVKIGKFIFGEFMSNIIADGMSWSKEQIKKAVHDKHDQSFSTKIYRVIEVILNRITGNKYKDSDILYEAIEKIFVEFKNGKDEVETVKAGLKLVVRNVTDSRCGDFIEKFDEAVCQDEELFKRRSISLQKRGIKVSEDGFQQIDRKIDEHSAEINKKLDILVNEGSDRNLDSKSFIIENMKFLNNKKAEYIKIWNSNLFLHNKENPKTLKEVFIMPDCEWQDREEIGFSYGNNLGNIISNFIKNENTSDIVITGVPGIGKTSLVAWIANEYKDDNRVIILRFRDWDREELDRGLFKAICNTLECKRSDLENKILILDGFDEVKVLDIGEKILNDFLFDLKDLDDFKCIVTSRPAYIKTKYFQNYVEISTFKINKVEKFYKEITGRNLDRKEKITPNLDVLGIPVILYMAIMSEIDISENPTKLELYSRIFAEQGGIFDKFDNGKTKYDKGKQILRNFENIKVYLEFLSNTAFKMFEGNTLSLPREDCEIPKLEFEGKDVSILDFPIKHLFESVKSNNIEFIHKSIYEYFVSEFISTLMKKHIQEPIELAGGFGRAFTYEILPDEILEFLKYKVMHSNLNNKFDSIENTFNVMIEDGMTYHTGILYKNAIDCEMMVFANMLEIIHLWDGKIFEFSNLISKYLKCNVIVGLNLTAIVLMKADLKGANLEGANLSRTNLEEANLEGADLNITNLEEANLREASLREANLKEANLIEANLEEADLEGANLRRADLEGANLIEANLEEADLEGANLREANLEGANLEGANLREADLRGADLEETNLSGVNLYKTKIDDTQVKFIENQTNAIDKNDMIVFLSEIKESVTYEEYLERRNNDN